MRKRLSLGAFEADFDTESGWLRGIRIGKYEIVQGIYGTVRNRKWETAAHRMRNLQLHAGESPSHVSFEMESVVKEIDFVWRGEILEHDAHAFSYRFVGEARAGFWRNRIGLCVLHSGDLCNGLPCDIEAVDGSTIETEFPRFVAPDQPFKRVRAMTYDAARGIRVEVKFTGEIFETEDQRNWTDASFKTYGTPLDEPFPIWIERGMRVEQSVAVRLLRKEEFSFDVTPDNYYSELAITGDLERPLPAIGFGMASHGVRLSESEIVRLRQLRPSHLRVDLDLSNPGWCERWRQAEQDASAIGTKLHIAVFLSDAGEQELRALADEVSGQSSTVSLWLIFHKNETSTTARWLRLAEAKLPKGAILAAGTNANFAELNRARPSPTETALPCYSMNPQVHALDDDSLIENLAGQAPTIESVRQFAPRPVVISPITLRPRFNAVATNDDFPGEGELPSQVDVRQMKLIGAAWTVGSLARLVGLEGLHSLTYFETTGWRGLMEIESGSPTPKLFPSVPGGVFPIFHIFAWLAAARKILPARSGRPQCVDGFCLVDGDCRRRWIVANLTTSRQCVRVPAFGEFVRIEVLHETMLDSHTAAPYAPEVERVSTPDGSLDLDLNAYAVAQITIESSAVSNCATAS